MRLLSLLRYKVVVIVITDRGRGTSLWAAAVGPVQEAGMVATEPIATQSRAELPPPEGLHRKLTVA